MAFENEIAAEIIQDTYDGCVIYIYEYVKEGLLNLGVEPTKELIQEHVEAIRVLLHSAQIYVATNRAYSEPYLF